ncbi:MAG: hypothetical protein HY535_09090 [Chloroflexi bacterium]|nr:hypothetical protein [Chloroflexota bacterium]
MVPAGPTFRGRPWRAVALCGLVLGLFLSAACGQGGYGAPRPTATTPARTPAPASTESPTPTAVRLDLGGYQFTPGVLEVEAGKKARIELLGDGLAHTFTIAALEVDVAVPEGARSQVVEFLVPAGTAGELKLVCSFHELAGMVGTVRVVK